MNKASRIWLSIFVACLMAIMWACSTVPVDKKTQLCQDAQMGYNLADSMLNTGLTPVAADYWNKYKVGAGLAIQLYCAGFQTPVNTAAK